MYACFFSRFFTTHIDDAMKELQFRIDTKKFIYDSEMKAKIIQTLVMNKNDEEKEFSATLYANQLQFIIDTWSKNYSEEELKFNVDMAIAMDYTIFIKSFDEDFKVDEEKLQSIKAKYAGVIPQMIEQIEKKETNKYMKGHQE